MAISKVNAAVTSSINADAITAVSANTMYEAQKTFVPAIYQITCASGTITNFQFLSGLGTVVTSGVTVSGTVSINLASTADRIRLWTDTGSNVVVTITKTASALTNSFSGTLDTITTLGSSTYTGTSPSGYAYVVLTGGGGGGAGYGGPYNSGGGGGGAGGVTGKFLALTGSMALTLGAGGTAATSFAVGGNGGTSTFAGMTANGGTGGQTMSADGNGPSASGGTSSGGDFNATGGYGGGGSPNGGGGYSGVVTPGITYPFVLPGVSGGGAGSSWSSTRTEVGTPGIGGNGGNGARQSAAATAGVQGKLYVLKF